METYTLNGAYNVQVKLYKRSGIVIAKFRQTTPTALTKGGWSSIGTIPEAFRPLEQIDALAVDNMGTSPGLLALQIKINTDGTTQAYAFAQSVANNQLLCSVSYIPKV